jgi:hypothetical protein
MTINNYAVFILTHGRPDKVLSIKSLEKANYKGPVYLICDDEDKTLERYKENFGEDKVIVFSKEYMSGTFDTMDNFDDKRVIVYARNIAFNIARDLKLDYFITLDDDYNSFDYRFNNKFKYLAETRPIKNITSIFEAMIEYLTNTSIKTICFSQGGDFIGGSESKMANSITCKRKAMNLFVCKTDRPINFIGRINEDVNTYVKRGMTGDIFLTTSLVSLHQISTQTSEGGMTELYNERGTYMKSFYSVIISPSSVKISLMGNNNKRLHHVINWDNTVPKIIKESYKKRD